MYCMPSIYLFETPFSRSQDFLSLPITQIVLAIFFDSYIDIYILDYHQTVCEFVYEYQPSTIHEGIFWFEIMI